MTYSCAISDKSASIAYRNMKQGGNSKREQQEMENMGMEEVDAPRKEVGKTSKNPWITFVKKYSQENGIKCNEALREIIKIRII